MESGERDPDAHDADRKSKDALAARGYWQAFRGGSPSAALRSWSGEGEPDRLYLVGVGFTLIAS
jgi:hypothetical protein